jgi:nuclear cap-binding protein subunit 1
VAAEVAAAFPPRGIIKLLPAARTGGNRPALDRLIAEEYILDTIYFFDGNRVDCAGRLAFGASSGGLGGEFAKQDGTELVLFLGHAM